VTGRIRIINFLYLLLLLTAGLSCKKGNSPPSVPTNPFPNDGAEDIEEYITLSWKSTDPDDDLLYYDVWLGEDSIMQVLAENITSTFFITDKLEKGSVYKWRIDARDDYGNVTEGQVWTFTTKEEIIQRGTVLDNRDGTTYHTIKYGNQWWMVQNLNYNIPGNSWCFGNNDGYCNKFGKLYTWEAALQACPAGWRLPSDYDWFIIVDYLGGWEMAGAKMKQEGIENWQPPNDGATNSSNFTALPGGYRYFDGNFDLFGKFAYFWTSTAEDANNAWAMYLYYRQVEIDKNFYSKSYGFSVRCVED